jgi:hypothetical protein
VAWGPGRHFGRTGRRRGAERRFGTRLVRERVPAAARALVRAAERAAGRAGRRAAGRTRARVREGGVPCRARAGAWDRARVSSRADRPARSAVRRVPTARPSRLGSKMRLHFLPSFLEGRRRLVWRRRRRRCAGHDDVRRCVARAHHPHGLRSLLDCGWRRLLCVLEAKLLILLSRGSGLSFEPVELQLALGELDVEHDCREQREDDHGDQAPHHAPDTARVQTCLVVDDAQRCSSGARRCSKRRGPRGARRRWRTSRGRTRRSEHRGGSAHFIPRRASRRRAAAHSPTAGCRRSRRQSAAGVGG